jgi:hypothetical protein
MMPVVPLPPSATQGGARNADTPLPTDFDARLSSAQDLRRVMIAVRTGMLRRRPHAWQPEGCSAAIMERA